MNIQLSEIANVGLKKVTDDMKTHKNPDLRLQTPQPYRPKPSPKPSIKTFGAKKMESVKPPKCVLENKKWVIEYQHGNKNLVVSDTNIRQTVYIFKCDNTTIQIKGKVNSIAVDGCKKTALLFDDVVSSVDFVNCISVQAQVTGKVHTINIDKTDGCMVYLSKDSVSANIVTAKSSEMNILVPDESGEFKEFALPEQFRSVWNGKRFVTEQTDLIG
ncbi:hypothetical protein LSH36_40g13044 [Paralvinella palmiformis]|uniref:C-CAP/cofactor C-like domain-containing protein n=1 Tax=Paralvinella palmiformis TaxID=53620 RepID=A0AAD9NGH3_9ANNE|nr:hypothetical protein LSH36_40g13044 [Paralvinella palmiformis]